MNEKRLRLGLIGKDVSKSLSKDIHTFILNEWGYECDYASFSVDVEDFDGVMRTLMGDFDGFNVTIPYKRDVMDYLSETVGDALECGSVNTVHTQNGKGYNTDGVGFSLMLRLENLSVLGKKVLVLGGGGAGRSCIVALKKAGACVFVYQRRKEELDELCAQLGVKAANDAEMGGYDILVNCTGVGMHDSEGRSPVSVQAFQGATTAVDLIYEPKQSEFLRLAKAQGLKTVNGESMLFYQAYYADCIYLGKEASDEEAKSLYLRYLQR